nr:hypothetical protein [Tengunoibacter tsumagoiensis]
MAYITVSSFGSIPLQPGDELSLLFASGTLQHPLSDRFLCNTRNRAKEPSQRSVLQYPLSDRFLCNSGRRMRGVTPGRSITVSSFGSTPLQHRRTAFGPGSKTELQYPLSDRPLCNFSTGFMYVFCTYYYSFLIRIDSSATLLIRPQDVDASLITVSSFGSIPLQLLQHMQQINDAIITVSSFGSIPLQLIMNAPSLIHTVITVSSFGSIPLQHRKARLNAIYDKLQYPLSDRFLCNLFPAPVEVEDSRITVSSFGSIPLQQEA